MNTSFLDRCNSSPTGHSVPSLPTPPANSILNGAARVILLKARHILVGLTILFQIFQGLINSLVIKTKLLILAYMSIHDLPPMLPSGLASSSGALIHSAKASLVFLLFLKHDLNSEVLACSCLFREHYLGRELHG